ncbi:uncharacterized protein AC631_03365 [Debaryomyces fabryi]|uniref:SH3 domain-containing protein n=1 Tax=Debaryomyces fabryi TaxID=58627 RepID=A0A0V1PXH2_9ASCO|nr:uncharacterized protein AC631_03365 [Debaryomyces fabryi]KSA00880.1 hypothetical protein AC631_03365 [Debaryomyces fabryi]CUM46074.1 unnamed protein product [Debaryomyces fabryi]
MTENKDANHQTYRDLFPTSTSIIDFAYSEFHPLRVGEFSIAHGDDFQYKDFEIDHGYDNRESGSEDEDHSYSSDEINCKAMALFDFIPENDNEVALTEGQIIWISYRHGQGWLVAEDSESGENGLVPEEYVEIFYDDEGIEDVRKHKEILDDIPKPFLPEILQNYNIHKPDESESEWVDTDDDVDTENINQTKGGFNDKRVNNVHGVHQEGQRNDQAQRNASASQVDNKNHRLEESVQNLSLS